MRRRHATPDAGPHALDEQTVERLLAGELPADQAPPGYGEVVAVLAAMAAPPSARELAGEEAALGELHRLRRTPPAVAGRQAGRWRRRRVGLAAVVVVGALVAGGGAAAATGQLPAPVRDAARTILGAVGGVAPAPTSGPGGSPASVTPHTDAGAAGGGAGSTGTTARAPAGIGSGSAASPNVEGLCRAYVAGEGGEQGKKLDAAAFQELARVAGGADKVPAYCRQVDPGTSGTGNGRQPGDAPKEPKGGPPVSSGQGSPGSWGPPPGSDGNQGQGPPATRSHGG